MISARASKCGVALIIAAIAASILANSTAMAFSSRAWPFSPLPAHHARLCCSPWSSCPSTPSAHLPSAEASRARHRGWPGASPKCLGKPGDRVSVDDVIFGQPPRRFGEVAYPLGVDNTNLDVLHAQRFGPFPLISSARLHHDLRHLVLAKPRDKLQTSIRGTWERLLLRHGMLRKRGARRGWMGTFVCSVRE